MCECIECSYYLTAGVHKELHQDRKQSILSTIVVMEEYFCHSLGGLLVVGNTELLGHVSLSLKLIIRRPLST